MGPNEVGWVQAAASTLNDVGMSAQEQLDMIILVSAHLRATQAMSTYGVLPRAMHPRAADVSAKLQAENDG